MIDRGRISGGMAPRSGSSLASDFGPWLLAHEEGGQGDIGLAVGIIEAEEDIRRAVVRPERNHSAPRTSQASRSSGWAWT